jgi:hypothetical protein
MLKVQIETKRFVRKNISIIIAYNLLFLFFTIFTCITLPDNGGFCFLINYYSIHIGIIHLIFILLIYLTQDIKLRAFNVIIFLILLIVSTALWFIALPLVIVYIIYTEIKNKNISRNFSIDTFALATVYIIFLNIAFMIFNFFVSFMVVDFILN